MNDLILLANLLSGPEHGYALKKQVAMITGKREMHNNLVYPLLRRFVQNGWVSKRQVPGQRGQTRELYALTVKGKQELLRRLAQFTEKEAPSEDAFHLRVGLFGVLDAGARAQILSVRDRWLAAREEQLARISASVDPGLWGGEVLRFRRARAQAERGWIARLERKAKRENKTQTGW
jgi:DNA-binding PadR family transcriptional regulator